MTPLKTCLLATSLAAATLMSGAVSAADKKPTPLLGIWSVDGPPGADQVSVTAMCRQYGELEFREKTLRVRPKANIEARPGDAPLMGAAAVMESLLGAVVGTDFSQIKEEVVTRVTYEFEDDVWFIKPADGGNELTLSVVGPNELRMLSPPCVMTRVTKSADAQSGGTASSAPQQQAAVGGVEVFGLAIGRSTLDSVHAALEKRGIRILSERDLSPAVKIMRIGGTPFPGGQLLNGSSLAFHRASGVLTTAALLMQSADNEALFLERLKYWGALYPFKKEGEDTAKFETPDVTITITRTPNGVSEHYGFKGKLSGAPAG